MGKPQDQDAYRVHVAAQHARCGFHLKIDMACLGLHAEFVQYMRDEFGHFHLVIRRRADAGIQPGQIQQLFGQAITAACGFQQALQRGVLAFQRGGAQGDLGVGVQCGEWCAQLMCGVGNEIAFGLHGLFHACQQRVERCHEWADFIGHLLQGQRLHVQALALGDGVRDGAQRAQRGAHRQPHQQAQDRQLAGIEHDRGERAFQFGAGRFGIGGSLVMGAGIAPGTQMRCIDSGDLAFDRVRQRRQQLRTEMGEFVFECAVLAMEHQRHDDPDRGCPAQHHDCPQRRQHARLQGAHSGAWPIM